MSYIGHSPEISGLYSGNEVVAVLNVMSGIGHIPGLPSQKGAASACGTVANAKGPLMPAAGLVTPNTPGSGSL